MALFNQLLEAQRRFQLELLSKSNVVGVAVGVRNYDENTGDPDDGEMAVSVLVEQKKPLAALQDEDKVPPDLDGARTDVVEVGMIRAQVNSGSRDIWRPVVPGGVTIGHYLVTAGTFGVLVYDRYTGEPLILSNNHVLANSNDAMINDPILQPAATDGGKNPQDAVARLYRYMPLIYTDDTNSIAQPIPPIPAAPPPTTPTPNPTPTDPIIPPGVGDPTPPPTTTPAPTPNPPVTPAPPTNPSQPPSSNSGCAEFITALGTTIARLNDPDAQVIVTSKNALALAQGAAFDPINSTTIEAQQTIPENAIDAALAQPINPSMFSNQINQIGAIIGSTPPRIGMSVRKHGRTTGLTTGTITLLNATIDVGYNTSIGRRTARFTGQIMTTGMSQGGDSGSLVVDANSQQAVGLLFAGSGTVTVCTPIEQVLQALNVQLTRPS